MKNTSSLPSAPRDPAIVDTAGLNDGQRFAAELFGLTAPALPSDPTEALNLIVAEDVQDALFDENTFVVRTRRAVRFLRLRHADVHGRLNLGWKDFLNRHFPGGHHTWSRYRKVGEVQMALHAKKLPMVSSEAQARVLAPWIRNRNFLKKVTALLNGRDTFPVTSQMAEQLGSSGTRPSTKAAKWRAAIRACDQLLGGRVLDKADVVVIGALRAQFVRRRDRVTPKGSQQMELGPLFDAGAASSGKLPSVPAAPAP